METKWITRCASCKWQTKKCSESCVMAPHFPQSDPHKFEVVHTVLGTSNVLKTLQGLNEIERADAVNSMAYEANARIHDPVHGWASEVDQLRKKIAELEVELAAAQDQLQKMRWIVADMASQFIAGSNFFQTTLEDDDMVLEDTVQLWDSLWD